MKELNKEQQNILLKIAKDTVEAHVLGKSLLEFEITDKDLNKHQGAFVTIHMQGKLRGCIGCIVSEKPLWQLVQEMAICACSEDYRFTPINKDELGSLDYEISVLSEPVKIDNWQEIELGKHGVIIQKGNRSGVFLPQVATETGWSKEEFLENLCSQKAGLRAECYKDDDIEIKVFTALIIS